MLREWFTLRVLVGIASVVLILAGLFRLVEFRTPDRPRDDWRALDEVAERDDVNLVFVLVDTLRADRLSAYGYERATSPVFDALADSGILFEDVRAQSTWTKTSMASLWTATYPATNRVTRYSHGLPESAETPTEILREAGFRTVGVFRNGWVAPNFGFGQGFDLYYRPFIKASRELRQNNPSAYKLPGTDQDITRTAIEFLRSTHDEGRFFLYLHYMDVHQYVYDGSADFGTTFSDIYDNAIHWSDKNLGAVVATLQDLGLMKRTVLVVASDHGEAFGEHGLEGHAKDLHVETTRVPLLVTLPFRLRDGIRVTAPVENVDIWPTLLDLLGLPAMPDAQGHSVLPSVRAAARGDPDPEDGTGSRYAHLDRTWGRQDAEAKPLLAVDEGRYRLFFQAADPETVELYDVQADPMEQENLAERHPERVASLRERLDAYNSLPEAPWGLPTEVELDDFELGQLRALGYVVEDGELPQEPEAYPLTAEERTAPPEPGP